MSDTDRMTVCLSWFVATFAQDEVDQPIMDYLAGSLAEAAGDAGAAEDLEEVMMSLISFKPGVVPYEACKQLLANVGNEHWQPPTAPPPEEAGGEGGRREASACGSEKQQGADARGVGVLSIDAEEFVPQSAEKLPEGGSDVAWERPGYPAGQMQRAEASCMQVGRKGQQGAAEQPEDNSLGSSSPAVDRAPPESSWWGEAAGAEDAAMDWQAQSGEHLALLQPAEAQEMLRVFYPQVSAAVLQQLWQSCGEDVQAVMQVLDDELSEAGLLASGCATSSAAAAAAEPAAFNLSAGEEFPPLLAAAQEEAESSREVSSSATPGLVAGASFRAVAAAHRPAPAAPRARTALPSGGSSLALQMRSTTATLPRVATGDESAQHYRSARHNARDYARLRNACFQHATQAYVTGDKALARELARQGREYALRMADEHASAADGIFRSRNGAWMLSVLPGGTLMLDLHGLHVAEARHILRQQLGLLAERAKLRQLPAHAQWLSVCVGVGNHTKGVPVRLPSAVRQVLEKEMGLTCLQYQAGVLQVAIRDVLRASASW